MKNIRRRDRRIGFAILVVFGLVFLVTLVTNLTQKKEIEVSAASLKDFDPGFIISDYVMGNYNSMTEAEIQKFLTSKNACKNTDSELYEELTKTSEAKWHFENGHFVCFSEEKFGDGEIIGKGETAAHIIWQAAQDYKINPQVLIVLLQKETSLITDPIPNNYDYRKATGYGCPDSAPCSSEYYGLKNQVRKAAALFSQVLNGGWTNYPLGENYIQYNPAKSCGGTTVNIKSLATSALYRYTPYQPNEAAISAGYGTGNNCSAYGNRNFYLFFQDWFGGITEEKTIIGSFNDMVAPRLFFVKAGARYVEPSSGQIYVRKGASFEFFKSSSTQGAEKNLCLALEKDKNCYLYADLEEIKLSDVVSLDVPRMMVAKENTKFIDYKNKKFGKEIKEGAEMIFHYKVNVNGKLCLMDCVLYTNLKELDAPVFKNMAVKRNFYVEMKQTVINTKTGIERTIEGEEKLYFEKLTYWKGQLCLYSKSLKDNECILYNDLTELNKAKIEKMAVARNMAINKGVVIDAETGKEIRKVEEKVLYFTKRTMANGKLCLQAEKMVGEECVLYENLSEIPNYNEMTRARKLTTIKETYYYDTLNNKNDEVIKSGVELYFSAKTNVNGRLCLQTKEDAEKGVERCVFYSDLREE